MNGRTWNLYAMLVSRVWMYISYPIMTIVKSNKFQALRRYAVGCCQNPYAMIFITHSPVKITRKTYSTFS
jgi:hypothetical protein